MRGCGSGSSRGANSARAAASFAAVTPCGEPSSDNTLRPARLSWSGAMTRSKRDGSTPGFCSCTQNVAPRLALRIASAGATDRRPVAISRSGHGGCSVSPRRVRAASGASQSCGGSQHHGAAISMRLMSAVTPSASTRPRHWFSMPILPSLTIQTRRSRRCRGGGAKGVIPIHSMAGRTPL